MTAWFAAALAGHIGDVDGRTTTVPALPHGSSYIKGVSVRAFGEKRKLTTTSQFFFHAVHATKVRYPLRVGTSAEKSKSGADPRPHSHVFAVAKSVVASGAPAAAVQKGGLWWWEVVRAECYTLCSHDWESVSELSSLAACPLPIIRLDAQRISAEGVQVATPQAVAIGFARLQRCTVGS